MLSTKEEAEKLKTKLIKLRSDFRLDWKRMQLIKLQKLSSDPNLWDNPEKARNIMQEMGNLGNEIEDFEKLEEDVNTLGDLGASDSDGLRSEILALKLRLNNLLLTTFLSQPYDERNAIMSINAGQGGTEAMDWTSMLYRMYLRYCERRGWTTKTFETSEGEEAGIKSVTFKVLGKYAYGYLKGESGTHRLVRKSPFNADNLRQTSFASVGVLPELKEVDLPEIEIKDADLEWQFFRASSQGGQNVQKVSTAVRVKHKPTGITATAQSERFQEANRKIALDLLRSRIWVLRREEHKKEVAKIKGEYNPPSWGTQIRSYVLHPYKMVKDLRTQTESSDPQSVLDGHLDKFIEAQIGFNK